MLPRLPRLLVLFLALAGTSAARSDMLAVSARVMTRTVLQVRDMPESLTVTERDVGRGWVEAAAPTSIAVRSNHLQGVMLILSTRGREVQAARAEGLGAPVQFGPAGGSVLVPADGHGAVVSLRFRLYLDPATTAGVYPWPVQVAAGT